MNGDKPPGAVLVSVKVLGHENDTESETIVFIPCVTLPPKQIAVAVIQENLALAAEYADKQKSKSG